MSVQVLDGNIFLLNESSIIHSFLLCCIIYTACMHVYDIHCIPKVSTADYFRASIFVVHLQPIKTLLDITSLSRKLAAITPGFTGMCTYTGMLIL